ncbi:MAG TPA: DinB family protein [Stellaceae bacterium]|nr:DinB family protein [Stellaceae bacterium]
MDTKTARMLAYYKAWADEVMFDGVAALPPGEAEKERKTLFKTIIGTLNHIYVVDLIWQAHLEGRDHGFEARNVVVHPTLAALRAAQEKLNDWIVDWAKAQSDASLAEDVPFAFVNGNKGTMKRSEIFLHLVTHGSYHRGWVAEMFFEAGSRPPQPDLSVFLCEAPQDWRKAI